MCRSRSMCSLASINLARILVGRSPESPFGGPIIQLRPLSWEALVHDMFPGPFWPWLTRILLSCLTPALAHAGETSRVRAQGIGRPSSDQL
jgi:hypothetical protein